MSWRSASNLAWLRGVSGVTEKEPLASRTSFGIGGPADFFVEQIFNFPTMTEAYRIAAFDVLKQRSAPQHQDGRIALAAVQHVA